MGIERGRGRGAGRAASAVMLVLATAWRADRDYIIADMNGSAVFLLAALKMRLTLAARRCGVGAEAAVDVLLRAMGLPEEVREAAWAVRRRRDGAGDRSCRALASAHRDGNVAFRG